MDHFAQTLKKELEDLKQELKKVEEVLENDPDHLEPKLKKKNEKR